MEVKKSRSTYRIENPSSSNSESLIGVHLPPELITEILLRLPVKSLLKSKCASKSWRSLISSPEFIRSHFALSSSREGQYSNHQLLFTTMDPNSFIKGCFLNSILHEPSITHVFDVDYPSLKPNNEFLRIVGIVDGLVCLVIEEEDLFIWNPVLRKSKHLPSPNFRNPEDSYFIYGFGYDESNDDYKVVSMQCVCHTAGGAFVAEVKVYSLLADSWRKIEEFKGGSPLIDSGKYANGRIHWLAWESGALSHKWKIVTLDMVSEKFGELQRPGNVDCDVWQFGVFGGRFFVLCDDNVTKKMDLWVMDKYGVEESWSKAVSIPYVDVDVQTPPQFVLCVLRNGEIVLENRSCLRVYHTKRDEFRDVELGGCNSYVEALVYVESLVWPKESSCSHKA